MKPLVPHGFNAFKGDPPNNDDLLRASQSPTTTFTGTYEPSIEKVRVAALQVYSIAMMVYSIPCQFAGYWLPSSNQTWQWKMDH